MQHNFDEQAQRIEDCIMAAQDVYFQKHGHYHPEAWKLLDALEIQDEENGVLALGGPHAKEWDEDMFNAAEKAFRQAGQR